MAKDTTQSLEEYLRETDIFIQGKKAGIKEVVKWQSNNCVCQRDEDGQGNQFMNVAIPLEQWDIQLKEWGVASKG